MRAVVGSATVFVPRPTLVRKQTNRRWRSGPLAARQFLGPATIVGSATVFGCATVSGSATRFAYYNVGSGALPAWLAGALLPPLAAATVISYS